MTVNMAMDLGAQKNPTRPTNRIVNIGRPKGVTVVNMSGEAIRKHREVLELRQMVSKYRKDLEASMNALSIANLEIERLKGVPRPDESEIASLKEENERLEADINREKEIEGLLKDEISGLRKNLDNARSELKALESENVKLREEMASLIAMSEADHVSKKRKKRRVDAVPCEQEEQNATQDIQEQ